KGREANPYRAGFLQLVAVADTDARAEELYARHVEYLSQVPPRPRRVVRAAGQPGLPQPPGDRAQSHAPAGEPERTPLPRLRREGLRHRGQSRHRPSASRGGGGQGPARGQPDGAAPDRLHAARADAAEHGPVLARGAALAPRLLGGRGLGQPLVAGAAARALRARGGREMSSLNGAHARVLPVWQGHVRMRVLSKGAGPGLVFFHGPWGLQWSPFLDALAESFTVHAPEHPGTSPGAPEDVYHLDNLWDLVLCYEELLEQLGLDH